MSTEGHCQVQPFLPLHTDRSGDSRLRLHQMEELRASSLGPGAQLLPLPFIRVTTPSSVVVVGSVSLSPFRNCTGVLVEMWDIPEPHSDGLACACCLSSQPRALKRDLALGSDS